MPVRRIQLFSGFLVCASSLLAQSTFLYTNSDPLGAASNSVSAFSVAANGALTPVPGSPFLTGGAGFVRGGNDAGNRITTTIVKNVLYAGNSGSNNVSAFSINPATGVLTPLAGSPFATGGLAEFGISLASTPDDKFLIAASTASNTITVYSIAANGALTQVPGSPFSAGAAGGRVLDIKVTSDGKFLAAARFDGNAVSMFSISATGGLTPVPGSPFPAGGAGFAANIDCNCESTHLYVAEESFGSPTIVSVQSIAPNGALSPIAGSPFVAPGGSGERVVLSPDDSKLFVSNTFSNTVTMFSVAMSGSLTVVPGSPFPDPGGQLESRRTRQERCYIQLILT